LVGRVVTPWDTLRAHAAELLDDPDLSERHKAVVRDALARIDRLEAAERAEVAS
jgi:hypothetical protein